MRSLRLILNINWQERITNMEELERTQVCLSVYVSVCVCVCLCVSVLCVSVCV